MFCAVCQSPLNPVEVEGVTIDQCSFCHALWFDHGELEAYSKNHKPLDSIGEIHGHVFAPKRSSQNRNCPRCETNTLQFGTLSKYDVWRCEDCGGFFVFSETIDVLAPKTPLEEAFSPYVWLLELFSLGVR